MDFQTLSDRQWEALWLEQASQGNVKDLPALAPQELQRRLHGTSGVAAIQGALAFRRRVLGFVGPIGADDKFLDFGCGWGRHIRVFLKDFKPENIVGVDIDPENIRVCEAHLPDCQFILSSEHQPLSLADASVKLAISFSVFSHINEESAKRWVGELFRVVKPGGFCVVTSWGRNLYDVFDRIKRTGQIEHEWERNIQRSFSDFPNAWKRYCEGEFVFGRHGSTGTALDPDVYGISLMPKQWLERNSQFQVQHYLDDPKIVPQTVFVLQRPPA